MPKEDYIEKYLNQMSRALGKILFNGMQIPTEGHIIQSAEMLEQKIEETLNLPFEKLMSLSDDSFIAELKDKKDFNEDNFQKLGDVLFQLAQKYQNQNMIENSLQCFKKCLALYLQVDKTTTLFSFERNQRLKMIERILA